MYLKSYKTTTLPLSPGQHVFLPKCVAISNSPVTVYFVFGPSLVVAGAQAVMQKRWVLVEQSVTVVIKSIIKEVIEVLWNTVSSLYCLSWT